MNFLIPPNEYGMFADMEGVARVDSLFVADCFGKRHSHVLRDIAKIAEPKSGLSEKFIGVNFEFSEYRDATGRKQPRYLLTRDGFTILVMGYTGVKAMQFKELYIRRFNEMEQCIRTLLTARQEFPLLTEQIRRLHENPKAYHFSNECDMLNRIVLGMSAKQFRVLNGIEKGKSIRPYLSGKQIRDLERLQHIDMGLMVALPNYQERKQKLEWYYRVQMQRGERNGR